MQILFGSREKILLIGLVAGFFQIQAASSAKVLEFYGNAEAVTLAESILCESNTTPFSIEYWVRSTNSAVYSIVHSSVTEATSSLRHDPHDWIKRDKDSITMLNSGLMLSAPSASFYVPDNLENYAWTHIAVTRDEEMEVSLYINGAPREEPLEWSGQIDFDNIGHALAGRVAEVRFWDHARTEEEIEQNCRRRLTGSEAGLRGYWPLNEGAGVTAGDLSAAANDATIHFADWVTDTELPLVPAESEFMPSAPLVLASPVTGSTRFTNTGRVLVDSFPVPDGNNLFQITLSGDPESLSEEPEAWTDVLAEPEELIFVPPPGDAEIVFYAWFTNSAESVVMRRAAGVIRYTTVAPVPSVRGLLARETGGFTVRVTAEDIDLSSSGGLTDGEEIPIHKLEVVDLNDPGVDLTVLEDFVTLDAVTGDYPVALRVINAAGNETLSATCSVVIARTDSLPEGERYVAIGNTRAYDPYDSWETAAPDLQSAVTAAQPGDRILVARGRYQGSGAQVLSITKPLQLTGIHPRDEVIIDGGSGVFGNRKGIIATLPAINEEDPDPLLVIENFSVIGCSALQTGGSKGVGIRLDHTALSRGEAFVRNCIIADNFSQAGTSANNSSPGTGMYIAGAANSDFVANVINCLVRGNRAKGRNSSGGGIYVQYGVVRIEGTDFIDNDAGGMREQGNSYRTASGGGALVEGVSPDSWIKFCRFEDNTALQSGGGAYAGGLHVLTKPLTVENSIFKNNRSVYLAGVRFNTAGYTNYFRNCLVVGNKPISWGAGIGVYIDTYLVADNCTIYGNHSTSHGGVVANYSPSGILLRNSIVLENLTRNISHTSRTKLEYCCTTPSASGPGNITDDPLFVDAEAGDFRLRADSPCRDSGTNLTWMAGARDLDGKPRLDTGTGRSDMGCYEYQTTGGLILLR